MYIQTNYAESPSYIQLQFDSYVSSEAKKHTPYPVHSDQDRSESPWKAEVETLQHPNNQPTTTHRKHTHMQFR